MASKRKKIAQEVDLLEATGQEDEKKAVKWVKEAAKIKEQEEKKKEEERLQRLDDKRKQVSKYLELLLREFHSMLLELNMPETYKWGVWYDGVGVRVAVNDPYGKYHSRAFKVSGDPKFDLHACYRFTRWVEDIVDAMSPEKLWIPKTN